MSKRFTLAIALALAFSLASQGTAAASTTWYSGMRAFGQVTVEPAVDLATGNEIFLLTPNKVQAGPVHAAEPATAPLYLVLYPTASTLSASLFNCLPTNCDHAQTFPGYALKGSEGTQERDKTHGKRLTRAGQPRALAGRGQQGLEGRGQPALKPATAAREQARSLPLLAGRDQVRHQVSESFDDDVAKD